MTRTDWLTSIAITTVVAAALAGCSAGPGDGVTLTIAAGWSDVPAVAAAFRGVVENFQREHPEIDVELEESGSNAYNESISLRAASANPPDAFMLSTAVYGPAFYNLATGGHLEPLDRYAAQRGWVDRFGGDAALTPFRVDPTTGVAGTGPLYGLPEQRTVLGVYYNRALLADLGYRDPPTTMAAFEETLAAAKAAGLTPIAATRDAYVHNQMILWTANESSADPISSWVFGVSGTFASDANARALRTLLAWQSQGYLQPGSLGTSYAGAVATFTGAKALYIVAGPWLTGTVGQALGDDAGFMRMPAVAASSPIGGGPSSPLMVSSRARHKAEAIEFLDFFNSRSQSDYLVGHGWGPPGTVLATAGGSPLDTQVEAVLSRAAADGAGIVPYINWASPTVDRDIYAGLESLLAGRTSVTEYLDAIQATWVQSRQQRGRN